MRILVTGGSGFIGSVLVPMLLAEGHFVRVFDSLRFHQTSLLSFFIHDQFEFVRGDIRNAEEIKKAMQGVDMIVHLAALLGAPVCAAHPEEAQEINVGGTQNILNARLSNQPIIYSSTGSNYGVVDGICTEETPLRPVSVYGMTKTKAETLLLESGNVVALRFATAFGISPRLRLDLMPNDFVFQALRVGNLIVYERSMKRTFIHVRDMARAFVHTINHFDTMKNNVYNVGDESMNTTKEQLAYIVRQYIDYYLHFAEIASDADRRDYEVSYAKIRATGYHTIISLEQGIQEMVKGFQLINLDNPYSNL